MYSETPERCSFLVKAFIAYLYIVQDDHLLTLKFEIYFMHSNKTHVI